MERAVFSLAGREITPHPRDHALHAAAQLGTVVAIHHRTTQSGDLIG